MFRGSSTGSQRHVDIASTQADVTKPEDIVRLAGEVAMRWDRVDTIIVWCVKRNDFARRHASTTLMPHPLYRTHSAGALTIQPVLCVTGQTKTDAPSIAVASQNASAAALDRLASLATASYNANVRPSLLLVPAFLQLLLESPAPRLAVLSSVAAEIPAPTRAIYAAHKAALSMLLRSMRIELESLVVSAAPEEKRRIGITLVHPASIDTGLRSSALDAPATAHASTSERKAMSASYVAEQVNEAIRNQEDEVWLPKSYWWISKLAMFLVPGVVKNGAKKKYGFA
jgi:NAD(P)-dependent dehydrogenase (short-subunit alcohol dehydrogenase family)